MKDLVTTVGGLRTRVLQAQPDAAPTLLVVFCHGFGASGEDLVPFVPELLGRAPRLASARFAFPAGPLSLGMVPWGDSRAWWPLDWERMSALSRSPEGRGTLREKVPQGLAAARRKLQSCVETLLKATDLGPEQVVLGGFSQGAMLATDLALHWEHRPAALVAFSGVILTESVWRNLASRRAGLPVLQSHGREDPILPYPEGEALRALLAEAGLVVDFLPFQGGHTIHPQALDRLARLLESVLPP